jgi:hypothetical protein
MKRTLAFAVTLASVVIWAAASPSEENGKGRDHRPQLLMTFGTMYGVDGPFLGDANAIRGVEGDDLPWVVRSARGSLDSTGHLRIQVRGLVFADDPLVPPELVGTNDDDEFRGLVSCLTEVGDSVTTQNVATDGFPATERGDSNIDARIELPNPCVAPILFVLGGDEDKWFAVTGFESEEEDE